MKSLDDMPAVRTPEAPQKARPYASWNSAFPIGRLGRLLQPRSISGLCSRSRSFRPIIFLSTLRSARHRFTTQDSVPGCWLGFTRATISGCCISCACKAQLPHHRAYGSRTRRFGRFSQTWKSALADSQFQPERALSSNQPRFHPSHQARARWTRRMPYRGSRTSHCSSLSIPSRGTVRAFGLRRCGSAYRLLRLSACFDPLKHRRGLPG